MKNSPDYQLRSADKEFKRFIRLGKWLKKQKLGWSPAGAYYTANDEMVSTLYITGKNFTIGNPPQTTNTFLGKV